MAAAPPSIAPVSGFTLRHYSQPNSPLHLFTDNHSYLFKTKLGQGADGVVWRATMDGKQDVAIKVSAQKSFLACTNECSLLSALNHKSVVKLHGDRFVQARQDYFVVMGAIDGQTLSDYRKEILQNTGRNPTEEIARPLFSQMVEILQYTHAQHVAHLDLSLGNLLIIDGK